MISWRYKGKIFKETPEEYEAFVYLLQFEDGSKYVGKKVFYSIRRVKVKGKMRRKVVKKESDWKSYCSSSEVVKEKLAMGQKLVKRQIIHLCTTRGEATYFEIKEMFLRDVLCTTEYLNLNIAAKFFKCYSKGK